MLENTRNIFLTTLSNKTRLKIIEILLKRPRNVTQICRLSGMDQTTVSHNLSRLKRCGFVVVKKRGKQRIYSLNEGTIVPLIKLMNKHIDTYCSKLCKPEEKLLGR